MTEASFTKQNNDPQFFRNEPVNYTTEIRQMMHGFGDCAEPLVESAKIIEEVVLHQMRAIIRKASEVAERRDNTKKLICIGAEDLIFLLRKDKIKLQRLLKYLELKEFKASIHKTLENDTPESAIEGENAEESKKKIPYQSFIETIDNTGELMESSSSTDYVKQNRCIRAEMMSRTMDEARYLKFSNARRVSFANRNRHKFSDWLCAEGKLIYLQ